MYTVNIMEVSRLRWKTTWTKAGAVLLAILVATIVPSHATITLPEGTFPAAKHMNIETCLVRFDVHPNTIIRTEESRSMGACFLDDADLNTREQCLRLCCETENCDVFVFEEKTPGTCFLFQCGPPENFRCKFTHHSNYTSAVLSIPPPPMQQPPPLAPPLAAQIQSLSTDQQASGKKHLSQHEIELVSLKETGGARTNSKQEGAAGSIFGATPTTLLPALGVRLGETLSTPTTSTVKHPTSLQQCGHFEFPCHSGECIAVYNVCDGIPQCEDGSDEGVDCPQKNSGQTVAGGVLNQPIAMMPPSPPGRSGVGNSPSKGMGGIGGSKVMLPMYQPLEYQQTPNRFSIDSDQQQLQQQQLGKPITTHRNREDPMTAPKPWPRPGFNEPNYIDSSDSRIFNHKGGLQLSAINNMIPLPSQQYQESLPEPNYMSSVSIGGVGGQPYLSLSGSGSYPQQMAQQMSPDQQQSQYKSVVPPQQWMLGNAIRTNWPLQSTSDNIPGVVAPSPREQYIQPPVQQRRPTLALQAIKTLPKLESAKGVPMSQAAQPNPSLTQTQPSSGQQWPIEGQHSQEDVVPVTPTPGSSSARESASGPESPINDAAKGAGGQLSDRDVGENVAKHKSATPLADSRDAGAEYEEDAYEDTYPDSANVIGDGGADAAEPTQTEPPRKKPRKHHKHDHIDGKDSIPSTANGQAEEKQRKNKKSKAKNKAVDHHHALSTDSIVHEHLKGDVHKDLEIEFTDHDGFADRPGGAMLSLTLGVLLTAAMGILLSCRMRVARRRVRRPGKSYAHDADFLVNGMYL